MLTRLYRFLYRHANRLPYVDGNRRAIKYIISGSTAAVTDLGLLFVFTDLFHVHYLTSSVVAFLFAFGVSFYLQKFWTFRDNRTHIMKSQMTQYGLVACINLGLNSLFIYLIVEYFHIWYLSAQIIASILVAFFSFFIYRNIIFHPESHN